jgi:hypothetical protein
MCDHAAIGRFALAVAIVIGLSTTARADNLLLNPGAEQGKRDKPSVWAEAAIAAEGLRMERSTDHVKSGKASLMIANSHEYEQPTANNWTQSLQEVPRGRTLRLSAAIRTEDADSANVCLQCWDVSGQNMLAFASTPVIRGDQDWIHVTSDPIVVPAGTASVVVRAALTGVGKVWFDDLEVSSEPTSATVGGDAAAGSAEQAAGSLTTAEPELPKNLLGRVIERTPVIKDCMVLSYIPDWQYGNVDNIAVANNDGGVRTLLAWKPLDPHATEGDECRAYLAIYSRKTTVAKKASDIVVAPLGQQWPELTSWKSQPKLDEAVEVVTAKFEPGEGWKLFDITPLLAKSKANEFGVMLKFKDEDMSGSKQDWSGYEFVSREGLGEGEKRHPQVIVVEVPAKQIVDKSSK